MSRYPKSPVSSRIPTLMQLGFWNEEIQINDKLAKREVNTQNEVSEIVSEYVCYVDGGCENNNVNGYYGKISYSFVINKNNTLFIQKIKKEKICASSNFAELYSLLKLLKELKKRKIKSAHIKTDSQTLLIWFKKERAKTGHFLVEVQKMLSQLKKYKKQMALDIQWIPREQNLAGQLLEKQYGC